MRLLMTTDTVGGVWTFTSELCSELLRRGDSIAMVSFGRSPSHSQLAWCDAEMAIHGDRFQFTPTQISLEWMEDNEHAFSEGEPLLRSIAEEVQPDLVLSNQFCFGAIKGSVPRIVVAHSDVLSWAKDCKPEAATPTPWVNRYTAMVQSGLMAADAVVAPTRWMLGALKPNFFLPRGGQVIPNGRSMTPTASLQPRRLQAVTAGRLWDEAKGLDMLHDCELPIPVLIAGETRFREADSGQFNGDLRFLGVLQPEQMQATFAESAIYLCTSRYEPFGLAPLEAALCGCAILARDIPSLREVWGEAALYFHDAVSLVAQVRTLAEDPAALAVAQRRAFAQASLYTAPRITDAYVTLFETVLQRRGAMPDAA